MNVVSMAAYTSRDTQELARWIVEHATEIAGMGVTVRMKDGSQHTAFTGLYRTHPEEVAGICLRLSMKFAKASEP